ncbi:MAG: 2-oxoacid:acceptor oxidoreductase family protein [Desulfurococcales archaeon]|nr:2-oxoacid:acceptor oxidoreductase family protein [Desulfurococcales archaeon]MEB3779614.1 2-oxoacid:acceptor oxidoreductase family protein [Desulfurococcales archaeon]
MIVNIRFHGRGGQGVVTAANILIEAAAIEGKQGQAFPYFGAERRGAPVEAYARIGDEPILRHSQVKNPDIVVVLDPGLPRIVDVTHGLKDNGVIVVNSESCSIVDRGNYELYIVDANKIAEELGLVISGWHVVNTSMLGALAKASGIVSLDSIIKAIANRFKGDLADRNSKAVERAYKEVRKCN